MVKPVTFALKVMVTCTEVELVGLEAVVDSDTVGLKLLNVRVSCDESEFVLPALSCTTPEPKLTVTSPFADGVTSKVYADPLPLKLPTEPFVADISSTVRPVTFSLNVKLTDIGDSAVGLPDVEDNEEIVGEVLSNRT